MFNPKEKKQENPYFTLVLRDYRKFEILEINSTIKDGNNESFIIKNLNCVEIIMKIIKDIFIGGDDVNYEFPYSIVEILGFIYAMKENFKNNKIILNPYFPSPFIPETKIEICENNPETLYIEQILYNKHVSLLIFFFFQDKNLVKKRFNILFDFSYYHYNSIRNKDPVFHPDMYFCQVFPRNGPIQFGSSSSIWFIGTLLKLSKINNLSFEMLNNNELLFDIIKEIHQIMKIDINILSNKLIEEKKNENISISNFISYKMALSPFINIKSIINVLGSTMIKLENELFKYQNLFDEFRKKIFELKMNFCYYEINSKKPPIDKKVTVEKLIDIYNKAKKLLFKFSENRILENNLIYKQNVEIFGDEHLMIEDKINKIKKELDD